MKTNSFLSLFLVMIVLLDSCQERKPPKEEQPPKPKADYTFSGRITTTKGEAVPDASIMINGKETKAGKEGEFKLEADSTRRFVVTVKKRGFGTISKVFTTPIRNYNYTLQRAFTKTIDPTKANTVKDEASATSCVGCGFQNLAFDAEYKKIPFVFNSKGQLTDFGWTPGLKPVFDLLSGPPLCNPGAVIMIPANTVVNSAGQPVTTPVTVSITTIDLQSPDGMPGDYTFESENQQGSMQSMGAVSIEVYDEKDNGESYNLDLKAKVKAKLALPADPVKLKINKYVPETIPVLYYDERKGVWRQEGKHLATLNKKTRMYETEVSHFSSINLDFFTNPTCMRLRQVPVSGAAIDAPGGARSAFRIYAMTNTGNLTNHSGQEVADGAAGGCSFDANGTNLHLLYNAPPPGTSTAIVLTGNSGAPTAFYGIGIIDAGLSAPTSSIDFTCPSPLCDSDIGNCFHANCVFLPLQLFNTKAILAVRPNAGNLQLKWVFPGPPPSADIGIGEYDYIIEFKDAAPGGSYTQISRVNQAYSTVNPVHSDQITAAQLAAAGLTAINQQVEVRIVLVNDDGSPGGNPISNPVVAQL